MNIEKMTTKTYSSLPTTFYRRHYSSLHNSIPAQKEVTCEPFSRQGKPLMFEKLPKVSHSYMVLFKE